MDKSLDDVNLLSLAAKAIGLTVLRESDHSTYLILEQLRAEVLWNPLVDDGDALRLASQLNLEVIVRAPITYAGLGNQLPVIMEKHVEGDHAAATRRAIVRAAAEIGKKL